LIDLGDILFDFLGGCTIDKFDTDEVPIRISPMVIEAIPSKIKIPVNWLSITPAKATTRPSIAALSSK